MNLDKHFMRNTLQAVITEFSSKVMPIDEKVELKFVDKAPFIESAKQDMGMKLFIERGIFTNFENEYPNFLVVYNSDKNPMRTVLGLPFYISICFEIAKDQAKSFTADQFREFLKHGFAHELAHVYDKRIKETNPKIWADTLAKNNGNEYLANEQFAEDIADLIGHSKKSKEVEVKLWSGVYTRARKLGLMK